MAVIGITALVIDDKTFFARRQDEKTFLQPKQLF